MSDKAVNIKITADGQQAQQTLGGVAQAMEQVGDSAQQAGQAQKGAGAAAQELGQKSQAGAQQASQALGQVSTSAQQAGQAQKGAGAAAQEMGQKAAQGAGLVQQSTHKIRDGVQSISTQLESARTELMGFLGIQLGAGAVKDVVALADAYKNLQSRIGLVVGEGEQLARAMDDVQAVALRTHASLESTGTLFARLAQAGKDAGLGLEQATAQGLALTETINQAVAVSGASAAASDAAITQLIQGLQSGVLRGDEFNSVMEQAPRLARALADGLGVTTGELRKLAENGALTTDVVVQSLQSQGQALEQEFGKMPLTVGKAITDVQTAFMRYVADVDAANGVTDKIAGAVQLVGQNLDTLGDALTVAGKGWLAFKSYNWAQTFLDKAKAIAAAKLATQEEAAATTANTTATAANTGAKAANAQASAAQAQAHAASTQAQVANTQAVQASAAAQAAASNTVGLFSRAISGTASAARGLVGLLGGPAGLVIAAVTFKDEIKSGITSVVEWGLGFTEAGKRMQALNAEMDNQARREQALQELRRQEVQAQAAREAQTRLAIAAQFDLSKAAQAATAEFAKLTQEGKTAAQAVKKITENFDTTQQQGLRDFATTLNKLAADGQLTAEQLKAAWGQILNGQDLQVFKLNAQQAFSGLAQEAQLSAQLAEAALAQALERTGLNLQVLKGGMGEAAASALNDVETLVQGLDALAAQGIDTSAVLTASLSTAINTADGQAAIDALRQQIKGLRGQLGETITNGLLDQAAQKARDLTKALEDSTPGIQSAEEAMRKLGITSDATLKATADTARSAYDVLRDSGTASAREVQQAFAKAAQAAIDAANGQVPAWVRAQAAAQGYKIHIDEAGRAALELANKTNTATSSANNLRVAWQGVEASIESAADKAARLKKETAEAAAAAEEKSREENRKQGYVVDTQRQTYDQAKASGLSDEQALAVADEFWSNGQKVGWGNARGGDTWSSLVAKRIDEIVLANAREAARTATPTATPTGSTYISNITLPGGGTQQIQFADANSQRAAEALLRQLAAARGSAAL